MQRTVGEHIKDLEARRDTINAQIMEESDVEQRNRLDGESRALQAALKFYREALETERRLSQISRSWS